MTFKALSFAAVALAGVNAAPIFRSCLSETGATGRRAYDAASYQPYRRANLTDMEVPSPYRISEVKVCTGTRDNHLKGFQFTLSDPADATSAPISLPYMGKVVDESKCETVNVPGPISTITTTTNNDSFVNSLTITSGDWIAEYPCAENCANERTWAFEDEPVVAMFGKLNSDDKIKQLGWLTLDLDC